MSRWEGWWGQAVVTGVAVGPGGSGGKRGRRRRKRTLGNQALVKKILIHSIYVYSKLVLLH